MRAELILNNVQNFGAEDYDVLQEAVKKLSQASESQFEEIKKEKWFNRVFDMVTFSQKGKKRVAEQVGTLAQAQQIFSELLVRLSANDEQLSHAVLLATNDIEKLQEQNIYLFKKIKQIENRALGTCSEMNISQLSKENKMVLGTILEELSGSIDNPADLQKNFAFHVLCNLNDSEYFSKPEDAYSCLENCEEKSRKCILTCCLEYLFLKDGNELIFEKYKDFIDRFDLGNKTIDNIIQKLIQRRNLVGIERFSEKYKTEDVESVEDCFFMEFEDDGEDLENEQACIEMEDEEITNILHIHAGETKKFHNKNIHVRAFVNCEGNLYFENCVLYYNETATSDEIVLAKGAKLSIVNSLIICKGYDSTHFIKCEGENDVNIDHTSFIDCSFFLQGNCSFTMNFCELTNCGDGFIKIYNVGESGCEISNNFIRLEQLSDFNQDEKRIFGGTIFDVSGTGRLGIQNREKVSFSNNHVINSIELKKDNSLFDGNRMRVFECSSATVSHCTFEGLTEAILACIIRDCRFEKCNGAVRTRSIYSANEQSRIEDCIFLESTDVINADDKTEILNCQFVSCENTIIEASGFSGGINVEFCDFVNTKNIHEESDFWPENYACIQFRRSKDSNSNSNVIKHCKFDGVDMNGGFLIATKGYEKPSGVVAYVENCDFRNCVTKRKSGCIIKQYMSYDTIFKKNQSFHAIKINNNCKGLEKINKENRESKDVKKKETNARGERIGAILVASAVIGAILPVAGPVSFGKALTKDGIRAIFK